VPALYTSFPPVVAAIASVAGHAIPPMPLRTEITRMATDSSAPSSPPPPPRDERSTPRLRTPSLPSVGLTAPGASAVHATLRDISSRGAGLARRGRFDLAAGTSVRLEIHEPGSERSHHLTAQVRWSRFAGINTYLGLSFDSPLPADHPLLRALTSRGKSPGQV
jgi:hypothetical protein